MDFLKLRNTTVDEFSSLFSHPLFPLMCPHEYEDNYCNLEPQQIEKVTKLWKLLNQNRRKKTISITFRGEKKEALRQRLFNSSYNDASNSKLASRIFYFGDKAKHYFSAEGVGRERLFESINDVSASAFETIFNELSRILSAEYSSQRVSQSIKNFSAENPDFIDYFQAAENQGSFVDKAVAIEDVELLRNYYLYLLHTFGGKRFSKSSLFISTSEDPGLARNFALSNRNESVNGRSIIYVCFFPREVRSHGISILTVQKLLKKYQRAGLPTYSTDLYKQNEISIKGGLFPQFLFGYFDLENYCFVVNPYIFDPSVTVEEIVNNGLKIDQSDFHSRIRETDFQRYLWAIEDNFSEYYV